MTNVERPYIPVFPGSSCLELFSSRFINNVIFKLKNIQLWTMNFKFILLDNKILQKENLKD